MGTSSIQDEGWSTQCWAGTQSCSVLTVTMVMPYLGGSVSQHTFPSLLLWEHLTASFVMEMLSMGHLKVLKGPLVRKGKKQGCFTYKYLSLLRSVPPSLQAS